MATTKKNEDVIATAKTEKVAEVKAETKAATKKTETKTAAKKETKKAPAKKAPAKKTAAKTTKNVFVEFCAKQISADEIVDKCVNAFKAENKGKAVESVEVYIKPEENVAYYVINGVADGKYVEL